MEFLPIDSLDLGEWYGLSGNGNHGMLMGSESYTAIWGNDTLVIQPDAEAGKDAYIRQHATYINSNYGTEASLGLGDEFGTGVASRMLLCFDLSGVPSGSIITSAALSLWEYYADGAGNRAVNLHRVLHDWTEAGVTWNKYDGANNWPAAGCPANNSEAAASVSATLTLDAVSANGFVSWSGVGLAADVQAWVNGTAPNYGWISISPTAEASGMNNYFRSSDYAVDAAQRPKLVVGYRKVA